MAEGHACSASASCCPRGQHVWAACNPFLSPCSCCLAASQTSETTNEESGTALRGPPAWLSVLEVKSVCGGGGAWCDLASCQQDLQVPRLGVLLPLPLRVGGC